MEPITMAEEQTPGVTDQAAVGQSAEGDTEATSSTEQTGENRQVPVSVLNAMRDELKTVKDQNQLYQTQLAQHQGQQPPATQSQANNNEQSNDPLSGREPDDLISVADVQKILAANSANSQKYSATFNAQLAKVGFMAEHPDYKDVLNGLKDTMANNDELATMLNTQIQASTNPLETAYAFAKAVGVSAKPAEPTDALSELDRILANQEKPGSPSAVSGGTGAVSSKSKFDNMSPEQFEQHLLKIKNG